MFTELDYDPKPKPDNRKKYTCKRCGVGNLVWDWNHKNQRRFLVDVYRSVHFCNNQEDVQPTTCKHCKSTDVVWVKKDFNKFELTESYGLPHYCDIGKEIYLAHKEAIRENYAFEKRWVNSFPDFSECRKCKGKGYRLFKRRLKQPSIWGSTVDSRRPCKTCKSLGRFTPERKKQYLQLLRKRYWPYHNWMKWSRNAL